MSHSNSKVVFVGNVPYGMTEEQLEDVFKTVGPVVGIRLVFDRESGKPKGYGFCEFMDHETASSAVRNLHGFEVSGRPLRVDLAESDPMVEGRSTHQGELKDTPETTGTTTTRWGPVKNDFANFMNGLPGGVHVQGGKSPLDVISEVLAAMPYHQLMMILSQMKAYVANYPDRARALLVAHPQLAYAFFQAMLMHKIVDQSVLERMLKASTGAGLVPAAPLPSPAPPPPAPPQAQHLPAVYPPPPPQVPMTYPPPGVPYYGMPPPLPTQQQQQQAQYPPPPPPAQQQQPQYQPPPQVPDVPGMTGQLGAVQLDDDQKRMLLQVMSLTAQQIAELPPHEREPILRLRSQLGPYAGA